MQDSPAAMMILGALRDIATELKAIHEDLQQLNQLGQRTDSGREGGADIRTARRPDSWPRPDNKQESGR